MLFFFVGVWKTQIHCAADTKNTKKKKKCRHNKIKIRICTANLSP